jgi:hypothetical protein
MDKTEMYTAFWWEYLKGPDHLVKEGAKGRIIILK